MQLVSVQLRLIPAPFSFYTKGTERVQLQVHEVRVLMKVRFTAEKDPNSFG